jgi:hypothetical protein
MIAHKSLSYISITQAVEQHKSTQLHLNFCLHAVAHLHLLRDRRQESMWAGESARGKETSFLSSYSLTQIEDL